jgi:RNA polymerase sigma-70 factor (ECF subfamily)
MAPKLYIVCKRYLKKEEEIEEVMADAFFTILTKLHQLKENYAFEAWARKIAVNNCLLQLKKNLNFNLYLEDVSYKSQPLTDEITDLEEEDLLKLVNYLPDGCKTVFNLFVIEGFSHKEIAEQLNVSEGTSKSQLNAAKTKLKDLVTTFYYQQAK